MWRRGTRGVSLFEQPVSRWIVTWYQEQKVFDKCLAIIGGGSYLALLGMCIQGIGQKRFKKVWEYTVVIIAGLMCFFSSSYKVWSGLFVTSNMFCLGKMLQTETVIVIDSLLIDSGTASVCLVCRNG